MAGAAQANSGDARRKTVRRMLSKVPEVTIYFWIIKIMATTVGETAADLLNTKVGLGLTSTTLFMTALLVIALAVQFKKAKYVPWIYWLSVVLISVCGTLITDNLVDNFHVSLGVTTAVFAVALVVTFGVWQASEKTLSIHSIFTTKREGFYWSAILFTFALGTAAGDLVAESLNVGYWKSAVLFGVMIGIVVVAWRLFKMNEILAFWIAYILTRPLGASLGDFLSQPSKNSGLGLGTVNTSLIFLVTILLLVVYLAKTHEDQIPVAVEE